MSEGLGAVSNGDGIFLSVAGGFIWNRKADKSDPNYAEQEFEKADKTIGVRTGAQYGDLTGRVTKVAFRTHPEYGESINVSFLAAGKTYIVSISTNNRYSQDMMRALLVMDLDKLITIKPYDFIGNDKKRAQGMTFKQDGEKLDLKVEVPDEYQKDEAWFKKAEKKQIKRYFEDLNEWYVAEVEEKVVPNIKTIEPAQTTESSSEKPVKETTSEKPVKEEKPATKKEDPKPEVVEESKPTVSILTMKKALRAYIAENYEGQELPDLSKEDLAKWYDLCIQEEELPWEDLEQEEQEEGELSEDELNDKLNGLMDDEE